MIGTLFLSVGRAPGLSTSFAACLWVELGALAACGLLVALLPTTARAPVLEG